MQGQDSLLEVFIVPVTVGASLECSDLVVDSFERSAGDRIDVPVEQPGTVRQQCLGHRLQDANA